MHHSAEKNRKTISEFDPLTSDDSLELSGRKLDGTLVLRVWDAQVL
jgi:hypothetical protein